MSLDRLQEAQGSSERFTDLRVDLRVEGSDELLLSTGGRWDMREHAYVAPASKARVLRVHAGEAEATRWWSQWLPAYLKGWPRPAGLDQFSALFVGGRRGGKTTTGQFLGASFLAAVQDAVIWAVSPTERRSAELRRNFERLFPAKWGRWYEDDFSFRAVNGTAIYLVSGFVPDTLKQGEAHLVLLNECQLLDKKTYIQARGAVVDTGGLVIGMANPPDRPIGQWVMEWYEEGRAGQRQTRVFEFDPRKNPHIVAEALTSMEEEVDEKTYAREVLGEFRPVGDAVFYCWSSRFNEVAVPETARDITDVFTRRHLGRPFAAWVGADFQLAPHMAGSVQHAFDACPHVGEDGALLWEPREGVWCVDEVVVEQGDEDDLIDALEALGLRGDEVAVVADASGEWQDAERTKGRGSYDVFRRRGWRHIFTPAANAKRNPLIVERCAITNSRMRTADGRRHFFADPTRCPMTCRALANWENRKGFPNRRSDFAHLCDGASYPMCRFYPRRAPPGKVEYQGLRSSTRADDWKEW
jgi:hypothetical protein